MQFTTWELPFPYLNDSLLRLMIALLLPQETVGAFAPLTFVAVQASGLPSKSGFSSLGFFAASCFSNSLLIGLLWTLF